MNSPFSALTWELWHRHRHRFSIMAAVILGFALLYPKLCALYGLRLDLPNALDAIPASEISDRMKHGHPFAAISEILAALFLLLGPLACMLLSLLYLVWIFTFAQSDPRKGFTMPARLFRLPISTGFLMGWLSVMGAAAITAIYLAWTRLVHLPRVDIFEGYPNLLVWLTLLLVSQGIVWSLDGFPVLRTLMLSAAVFFLGYLAGPSIHDVPFLARNRDGILLALLLIGAGSGFVGLNQIRHGAWQAWKWPAFHWAFSSRRNVSAGRLPFKNIARAQFWFEWRRVGLKLVIATCALGGAGVLIMAAVAADLGVLSEGDTVGLVIYLLVVPVFVHFVQGIMPQRNLPVFLATRPLTSGEVIMAKLKSAALTAMLCWLITFGFLALVPLLGNVFGPFDPARLPANYQHLLGFFPVFCAGVIVLTWRLVAVNLWCGINHRWLSKWPVLSPYVLLILYGLLVLCSGYPEFRLALPFVLGALVVAKFWLAGRVFRICLRRGWLSPSAMLKYLGIWVSLVVLFLVSAIAFFHREDALISVLLGIILLLPLARIGLAVLVLNLVRHR